MIAEVGENRTGRHTLVLYVLLGRCPHEGSQKNGLRLDFRKFILLVQQNLIEVRFEAQESLRDL